MSLCVLEMLGRTVLFVGASLIGVATLKKETKDLLREKASAGLIRLAEKIKPQEINSQDGAELIRALLHLN